MKAIIVQTTCPNKDEAENIAKILIEQNLAACVQMSNIESFYKWEEKFCNEKEVLLTIKTKKENFKKVKSKIKELHSYDLPEIIAVNIDKLSKDYKKFIAKTCK